MILMNTSERIPLGNLAFHNVLDYDVYSTIIQIKCNTSGLGLVGFSFNSFYPLYYSHFISSDLLGKCESDSNPQEDKAFGDS